MMIKARTRAAPAAVVIAAFAGALAALAGGYWDDAWHTERGRDAFLIAPHVAIYAGIALAGAALSFWLLLATRRAGLRAALGHGPLALALLSVGVTLTSGPIDGAWHEAFGRDAVIWSPPHMLGIIGTMGLGAALLIELAPRREWWGRPAAVGAGALVLTSAAFATVEYDTDVPQFDVAFYLPVLAFGSALAFVLVRAALDGRWSATAVAGAHLTFVGCASLLLVAFTEFAAPGLPLLVPAAAVLDLGRRRRVSAPLLAAGYVIVLHVAYLAVRNGAGGGVEFGAADVVASLAMSYAAVLLAFVIGGRLGLRSPRTAALAAVVPVLLLAAPAAIAHDPGQGTEAGSVSLVVTAQQRRVTVEARTPAQLCADAMPVAVVARRAGTAIRARLTARNGCTARGALEVPTDGRWFVYAEFRRRGETIESWLPVIAGRSRSRIADPSRYAYVAGEQSSRALEVVGGAVLYAAILAYLLATSLIVRRSVAVTPG